MEQNSEVYVLIIFGQNKYGLYIYNLSKLSKRFSPPQETAQKGLKEKRIEKRSINLTYQRDFNQNIIQTHRFATFSWARVKIIIPT